MSKFILLFPGAEDLTEPLPAFVQEYRCACSKEVFETRLFDLDKALKAGKLNLSKGPSSKRKPALLRIPRLCSDDYKQILEAAKQENIYLMTSAYNYADMHYFHFGRRRVSIENHVDVPRTEDLTNDSSVSYFSDMRRMRYNAEGEDIPVANNSGKKVIIKNLNLDSRILETIEGITKADLERLQGTHQLPSRFDLYSNFIVQEHVDLKRYQGLTNEWRAWFFDGCLIGMHPNSPGAYLSYPPPKWLVDKHRSHSPFYTLDFAELSDGDWLIISSEDGQVAKPAAGQSASNMWGMIAQAAEGYPHLPEWIWCLVANINDESSWVSPDGRTFSGSKHFRAGAKIYVSNEWHYEDAMDKARISVVGQARGQRKLIQVYLQLKYLHNFRLKKVFDKRVIERMTRADRGYPILGKGKAEVWGWDNSDASRQRIEELVRALNTYYGKVPPEEEEF